MPPLPFFRGNLTTDCHDNGVVILPRYTRSRSDVLPPVLHALLKRVSRMIGLGRWLTSMHDYILHDYLDQSAFLRLCDVIHIESLYMLQFNENRPIHQKTKDNRSLVVSLAVSPAQNYKHSWSKKAFFWNFLTSAKSTNPFNHYMNSIQTPQVRLFMQRRKSGLY